MRQMLKEDWVEIPDDGTCVPRLTLFRDLVDNFLGVLFSVGHSGVQSECKENFYIGLERQGREGLLPYCLRAQKDEADI